MKNIFRINEYSLLKIINPEDTTDFALVSVDELELTNNHYIIPDRIANVVWDSGIFQHQLNKIYSEEIKYPIDGLPLLTQKYLDIRLMLKQGVNFDGMFGLHLIIKSNDTGEILVSEICTPQDFELTNNRELINGSFWLEEIKFKIPDVGKSISAEITRIEYTNIEPSNGLIFNYPMELLPLVSSYPYPEYITTSLIFDSALFLNISLHTTENLTIKQSLLNYFGYSTANIDVRHVVKYGNDIFGYKTIEIKNVDNQYAPISVGLDLSVFSNLNDIIIFVSTEILVDDKLIKRENQINVDLAPISTLISNEITHPDTNYIVNVVNEQIINQQIIEKLETTKIIPTYQPIFSEFISTDFVLRNQNIHFNATIGDKNCMLIINKTDTDEQQQILSKITSDNRVYFDISELKPITKPTTYLLTQVSDQRVIGAGNVLLP